MSDAMKTNNFAKVHLWKPFHFAKKSGCIIIVIVRVKLRLIFLRLFRNYFAGFEACKHVFSLLWNFAERGLREGRDFI